MTFSSAFSAVLARWLAALLLAGTATQHVGEPWIVQSFDDLSAGVGAALESRVAARSPETVDVGWCVAQGENEGIYLRRRESLVWENSPLKIDAPNNATPRDLQLLMDDSNRLHLVWTAMDNGRRRVFYAVVPPQTIGDVAPRVIASTDEADADYPLLALQPTVGIYVVWQSAQGTHLSIEAARVSLDGTSVIRLPSASGDSRSAVGPQIVDSWPLTAAWSEILDSTNEIRAGIFNIFTNQWETVPLPGLNQTPLAKVQPIILFGKGADPLVCWTESGEEGNGSIRVARGFSPDAPTVVLNEPRGNHRQPQPTWIGPGQFSLAWRHSAAGENSIRWGTMDWSGSPISAIQVSPSSHHFAADPSQACNRSWSVVTWVDDAQEGGSGQVGFAEILNPSTDGLSPSTGP